MVSAVVYARISDDRAGSGLGVARQEKDCRALCAREGWHVAEVIVDNDRSAYSGRRRPGYQRLLEGLKAGSWEAVVAWHPDRLHRSPKELEAFIDVIESAGTQVATVMAGHVDLATATGRMTARVVGAVARHESEQKSERLRRKHQELAEAGKPAGGGTRPFGYLDDRTTVDPVEAAFVQEAARAILDGRSLRSITIDLQARGVPTVTGVPWTSTVIRRILTSPRTAGVREHGGQRHPGAWEPLLDEVTWRRVRAVILDPDRRTNHSPRTYLLTGGIAFCALCGHRLVARPRGDKARCYVCASGPGFGGCGHLRVLAQGFEDDVLTAVTDQLRRAPIPDVAPVDSDGVLAQIDSTEAALAELAGDYYADRSISRDQFQAASAKLNARLDRLRSEATLIERRQSLPSSAAALAVLAGDDMLRKRAVVAAVVERVELGPAVRGRNFYDPGRVKIRWRD